MPPHDIISSLYEYPEIFQSIFTGVPGDIQQYWEQNMDLFDLLAMPDLEAGLHSVHFFGGWWSGNSPNMIEDELHETGPTQV